MTTRVTTKITFNECTPQIVRDEMQRLCMNDLGDALIDWEYHALGRVSVTVRQEFA